MRGVWFALALIFLWPLLLTPYFVVYVALALYAVMGVWGTVKDE